MPNANVEKIKASLLKEIKGVFCEGYCLYYKDDYYCGACPLNDTSNWLNRKKPIAREEKLRTVNFCDDCIHFRPLKEGEKDKPNSQLCEFVRPLRFKVGNGYNGEDTGFFLPGCKDYKKEERECCTCLHYLPSEDSDSGECSLYSDTAYSHYLCNDWKSKD